MFAYKHTETIGCVKKWPNFYENYKLHGQTTREFLGLRMKNFQYNIFTWKDFQNCMSVPWIIGLMRGIIKNAC